MREEETDQNYLEGESQGRVERLSLINRNWWAGESMWLEEVARRWRIENSENVNTYAKRTWKMMSAFELSQFWIIPLWPVEKNSFGGILFLLKEKKKKEKLPTPSTVWIYKPLSGHLCKSPKFAAHKAYNYENGRNNYMSAIAQQLFLLFLCLCVCVREIYLKLTMNYWLVKVSI